MEGFFDIFSTLLILLYVSGLDMPGTKFLATNDNIADNQCVKEIMRRIGIIEEAGSNDII
jgi:hypothetical protein